MGLPIGGLLGPIPSQGEAYMYALTRLNYQLPKLPAR